MKKKAILQMARNVQDLNNYLHEENKNLKQDYKILLEHTLKLAKKNQTNQQGDQEND